MKRRNSNPTGRSDGPRKGPPSLLSFYTTSRDATLASGTFRRALLRFDLSSIPAGAVIREVRLTLYQSRSRTEHPVAVHRLLSSWGEGASNGDGEAVQLGENGSWQAAAPWDTAASGAPIRAFVNGNLNGDNSVSFALAPGQWTTAVGVSWMTDATTGASPGTLRLEIFDASGALIDAVGPGSASVTQNPDPPFGTSYVNGRVFHGFDTEGAAQIGSFRVTGDDHVYGDVVYAQPIPEPSEIAFMLAGLAAAGAVARRRAVRGGASAA